MLHKQAKLFLDVYPELKSPPRTRNRTNECILLVEMRRFNSGYAYCLGAEGYYSHCH